LCIHSSNIAVFLWGFMRIPQEIKNIGLSQYELKTYIALVGNNPSNGSQLSRNSGIPRARIYDVLRGLMQKGIVTELDKGLFAPLPPEELIKRLTHRFNTNLAELEAVINAARPKTSYEHVWTLEGYYAIARKAEEMIDSAKREIYTRLFPEEAQFLSLKLKAAEKRGVEVKYISMGIPPVALKYQIIHPEYENISNMLGGHDIEVIVDKQQILIGLLMHGQEDKSPVNWTKSYYLVMAGRDALRHDFFHYFLYKTYELGQSLTEDERQLYNLIKNDHWQIQG
jgi:HTH-type transcriptional regulator, sugar sensing transcriptional regulator